VRGRSFLLGVALVSAAITLAAEQLPRPLAPTPPEGQRVAPFFDGFYENADGTVSLSFGYSNLNATDVVEIPLGPNNFIEPKEFDGRQPTSFPPVQGGGPTGARRDRERGVFTVTIPAKFTGDVVWTLRHAGQTHKVPGRTKTGAYGLRWPMAMGSIPPLVGFTAQTMTGRGPVGIESAPMQATVGVPLPITIWTKDDSERDDGAEGGVQFKARGPARPAINIKWYKHSGPGPVKFDPETSGVKELEGSAASTATFTQAGIYTLRVRVDNFGRPDTSAGNQCCWTNGFIKVTVK
jgi:hypothetical protein